MNTILDNYGRIVIPRKIRKSLNLKPGTQIRIDENDQMITLKAIHEEPTLVWKGKVLVYSGTIVGDIDETLKKHREERIKKVTCWKP